MLRHHLRLRLRLRHHRLYYSTQHQQPIASLNPTTTSLLNLITAQPNPFPPHFLTATLPPLLSSLSSTALLSLLAHLPSPHLLSSSRLFLSLPPTSSLSLFHHLHRSLRIPISTPSFNSLLISLFRRGRTHLARRLFDEIPHPETATFNTLIRGLALNSSLDDAFAIFNQMPRPDIITYNTLLDALCRSGRIDTARNFFNGMKRRGEETRPNVVSYTTLIRGHSNCDVEKAIEILDEMVEVGLKPNKITYNTIVKGLCNAKRMDLVKEVLGKGNMEFKPDTCTFNTIMAAYCGFGRVEEAEKVFERMLELRVKRDSASYSTLIRGLCGKGEFERAERLVDEVLEKGVLGRRGVCKPLIAAYNPIFEYYCRNGKARKAGMLLKQLVERKATMDIVAFKTVILGYCREGQLREGYKLMSFMVRRNFKPDLEIFEVLMEGFLAKEDVNFAWRALGRMLNCGHRPGTSTFHSVLMVILKNNLAEESGNLIAVMVERKIRHNIDLSTDVVDGLLRTGLNERAFEIVRLLYDNGYCVKMEKLVGCLHEGKKYLEAQYLLLFSLERNENLDVKIHERIISGLCAIGKASEAFELFYGLTEKGTECDAISSCLKGLRNALEETGKLREAEFVSKQMSREKTEPHMSISIEAVTPTRAWYNMTDQQSTSPRRAHKSNNGPTKGLRPVRKYDTTQPHNRSGGAL